jgi:hypothetical protein
LNATIAVLALRQFEQTEHRKPSSLDQLVPKYLPALPVDEFDGRPLHYRVNPDGKWVLYSVGPNQTDEDALKPASEPRNCWDPGDVVFSEADFESERHRLPEKR